MHCGGSLCPRSLLAFSPRVWGIIMAGTIVGIMAPLMQYASDPMNMGCCVACFERDTAGALGLIVFAVIDFSMRERVEV